MTAPKEILDLVGRFDRNRDSYRSAQYNETQLRREFLDPFFIALGVNPIRWTDGVHSNLPSIFMEDPPRYSSMGGRRR